MGDDAFSLRSSLSITTLDNEDDTETDTDAVPMKIRILNLVKSSKNFTIRPARVSQELGLSINDASAELCGLLKAVGEGSTFTFETVEGVPSMVFTFPPDFEQKARLQQRKEDFWAIIENVVEILIKVAKVLTALGLIISTVIVAIAGMLALVAALVALSRGGNDSRGARTHVTRQLRSLFVMVRQLLWCYAMFGPTGDDQDPFFRETAYDTWLVLSVCCGNPGSIWFWMRANHLRRRRRHISRGWGTSFNNRYDDTAGDLEGVSLIRRGAWGQEEAVPVPSAGIANEDHRGLLSLIVEFLFGPASLPGPTESDKWRLRSAFIVQRFATNDNKPIELREFSPFVDNPPKSLNDVSKVVSEGLLVVAHFNGVPSKTPSTQDDPGKAPFVFPELLAESSINTRYENNNYEPETQGLLFHSDDASNQPRSRGSNSRSELPEYLYEQLRMLTGLSAKQFYHVLFIAVMNFTGVIFFDQSLSPGGILEQNLAGFGAVLRQTLIPVLQFYAKLFFFIPGVRLLYIICWNKLCKERNQRRKDSAIALKGE